MKMQNIQLSKDNLIKMLGVYLNYYNKHRNEYLISVCYEPGIIITNFYNGSINIIYHINNNEIVSLVVETEFNIYHYYI